MFNFKRLKNDYAKFQIDALQNKYADYWIFIPFEPLGDFGIGCSLLKSFKEKYGGKILVITRTSSKAKLARLFDAIDEIVVVNKNIYKYMFRNPNCEIVKGKYYAINHWKFINAPRHKSKNFLELYANMLGIDNPSSFTSLIFSDRIKNNVNQIIKKMNLNVEKTVVINKDSRSFDCDSISDDFWLKTAEKYASQGFEVVFNSNKSNFYDYRTIFLDIDEQLYFCSLCKKNIGIRSGFNDLLALMNVKDLEVYYPSTMFFKTVSKFEQLTEFKRAFLDEEDKTFDENMFRITSLSMFQLEGLREIILKNKE